LTIAHSGSDGRRETVSREQFVPRVRTRGNGMSASQKPLACVLGGIDLVRALALGGIRSAVVAKKDEVSRYSRFVSEVIDARDPWSDADRLVERLLRFAETQRERPVLYYDGDGSLLVVSRYRERLREAFRFVVPEHELVEELTDKARFQRLAERLGLPVPRSVVLNARNGAGVFDLALRYPLILKPRARPMARWDLVGAGAKAVQVETPAALRELGSSIADLDVDVLAQELVPGPESRIESYHAYINAAGEIVGEFTGRKIRTYPSDCGYSTAVVVTATEDVAETGRDVLRRLDLRGVAKCDFKRGPDGRLKLLEVNPRFNLWHHPGAKAGVNLPALVYADLVGVPREKTPRARAGVCWCSVPGDVRAARQGGVPLRRWLFWAVRCEAKWAISWDDPLPFLRGVVAPRLSRMLRLPRLRRRALDGPAAQARG
jgi:predicted ATP-grasp superfamily ATP-dependent carboligase